MALPTRRDNEGSSRPSEVEAPVSGFPRTVPLTVKLNGRAEAPDWRRGRTLSSSARRAQPPAHHGPFQRWLEDAPTSLLCARGIFGANRSWLSQRTTKAKRMHNRHKAEPPTPALVMASPPAHARTSGNVKRRVLASDLQNSGSPSTRILVASSNGEVERPRRSAGLATRAHTVFQRPPRPTTCASRPVPTLVRGRPHPAYCARAVSSAQTLPRVQRNFTLNRSRICDKHS